MSASASRRAVLAAGAAGLTAALTACGDSGDSGPGYGGGNGRQENGTGNGGTETGGTETGGTPQEPGAEAGAELGPTSDIPVGQGKVFRDEKVVVTQPTNGDFKAYSAVCTHENCLVSEVSGGTINCACHGSKFNVADGTVASGPAQRPLPPASITVDGNTIKLG
ncbi:Rieske (2Fe-2S) protein [Streptomyces alkaliterrae]|uniref:Cytochrome bc1 complex Rieske iron-sulfur subunit n=1 Tax=Streptomyces alkaliterrae TaxID=2213162 RepID=A0A5P0YM61_9ACTN|nr:Rieske (2Fe-2S) protein [Streptomyces alkaliterrae]MBB1251961.1 Rieske (2Fe-2S) protein [Streptomyces alkaliterrae]MBB1257368.1 Rieske (2Fe-2S) protein [Streptomyces alkaliterrae]MQS00737.1 Rieske 2Fe-2S domain-containing protein [Streptomyces alkaliterrae]